MAVYAAVVSLLNTIHNIHNHSHLSTSFDKFQMESLGEFLGFLLDFVENHQTHGANGEAEDLESRIASVAHAAEDVIESHIANRFEQLMARSSTLKHGEASSRVMLDFFLHIMQLIEDRPSLLTSLDQKQIESLDLLLNFIENLNSHDGCKEAEVLESQIVSESCATNDEVNSQLMELFDSDEEEVSFCFMLDFFVSCMEQILNNTHIWTSVDGKGVDFFGTAAEFLQPFTKTHFDSYEFTSKGVEDLERQMAAADFVDQGKTSSSSMLDLPKEVNAIHEKVIKVQEKIFGKKLVFSGSENSFLPDLQEILEDMESIKEKVIKVKQGSGFNDLLPPYTMPVASSKLLTGKTRMVGFDSYLIQLMEWLTAEHHDLLIISITGMGGIGKTTLARKVYEDLLVMQHFDFRIWFTISQDCNVRELLYHTLSGLVESPRELDNKTEDGLGILLHKILFGRRYLVILDDMWSIETWNKIMLYFPREEKRSRIVVTTRQSDVADLFGSLRLALDFLDYDTSWELFCNKAFEQGCCPTDLEIVGHKIVEKCKGFPLSIVVIGGLLGKSSMAQEHWVEVEKDLSSILNSAENNQCFNILSLSYSYLPAHLKPCFLYLGTFPEDHEIRVSRLSKLWVAEGILKPNKELRLEKVAKSYIEDLIARNLLLVRSLNLNGKVKTCSIHDLLRDLCIKVAEKEKFFCLLELSIPRDISRERRLVTLESIEEKRGPQFVLTLQSTSVVRSLINECESPFQLSENSPLLRVFSGKAFGGSFDTAFQPVNLRFSQCHLDRYSRILSYKIPSSISLLWNLQTLIIEGSYDRVVAPYEIWEMQQLRHLLFRRVFLPKPRPLRNEQDRIVLRNLQTLQRAYLYKWSEEVCKRLPNIKKLGIEFVDYLNSPNDTLANSCYYNVGLLNKLESLFFHSVVVPRGLLQNLKLPTSLKKLFLHNKRGLIWDELTLIGSLPHLEVLHLGWNSVEGPEWNPLEGEFLRLKYLQIYVCSDLIRWNADSSHFPALEKLIIVDLDNLDEIPSGIGDIPTLQDIQLDYPSDSVLISAVNILKEQESLGNQELQVRVKLWNDSRREEVRQMLEREGIASLNLKLS